MTISENLSGSQQPIVNIAPPRNGFRLQGQSVTLDPRVHAARGDVADIALAGVLFAPHYAQPVERQCAAAASPVFGAADSGSEQISELLAGERFAVLDITAGWAWGYCVHDHYVGFVDAAALGPVSANRARVHCAIHDGQFMGALIDRPVDGECLRAPDDHEQDPVAVARRLLGSPYRWGGRTAHGIDCSGLVQVALSLCGIAAPRDSDLQMAAVGVPLSDDAETMPGDLIFFNGHVGLAAGDGMLLHATGSRGMVVEEPLADVVERKSGEQGGAIIARRRIAL